MVPNMVLRPRLSSIRKNSVDQKGLAGKRAITSVNAMKARPVPSTPCTQTKGRQKEAISLNKNFINVDLEIISSCML